MDDTVSWIMDFTIKPGQLDTLSPLVAAMTQSTQAEPGALQFAWSVNDDGTSGLVSEQYADTDAALAHLRTFTEHFAAPLLAAVTPTRFTVLGLPGEALQAALQGFGPVYLRPVDGVAPALHSRP
jgi:quinol monooxygenase YgiN